MAGIKLSEVTRAKEQLAVAEARSVALERRLESLERLMRDRDFDAHPSRNDESRLRDSRDSEIQDDYNMYYRGPLHFDPEEIPDGIEYHWVRESCKGVLDSGRTMEMVRKGWTAVPPERHPERCYAIPGQPDKSADGCIRYKDVILMERSKRLNDRDRRFWANETRRAIDDLPGLQGGVKKLVNNTSYEAERQPSQSQSHLPSYGLSNLSFGN